MTAGRRAVGIGTCLAVVLALLVVGTGPASAAAKKRSLSLKVSTTSTVAGAKVTFSGKLTRSPKRTKVKIQRLSGRRWKTVKTVRTTSKGRFKTSMRVYRTASYRAYAAKTKKLRKAVSKRRTVRMRPAVPPLPRTIRVSRGLGGAGGDDDSSASAVSADGRYVAYESYASDLVPGDSNQEEDVFLYDRASGATVKVSQAPGGGPANGGSFDPSVSADGRFVAFTSGASNLVAGDSNATYDVFVWDRLSGATVKVSQGLGGAATNDSSFQPSVSADGRFVAFMSGASNIVAGDNAVRDVFVWDRQDGATLKVSQGAGGAPTVDSSEQPTISADGRYVAFESYATNLVVGDTNGRRDVFVWDRQGGATAKVSQAAGGQGTDGASSSASLSADGRYVAYASDATTIVAGDTNGTTDVFVWDRQGGTVRASQAPGGLATNGTSFGPSMSADGRYVGFASDASSIVAGDVNGTTDVFVWDRQGGGTVMVSQAPGGAPANDSSSAASVSGDGRHVAYDSYATNLVAGDTNGEDDVFVWDRLGTA